MKFLKVLLYVIVALVVIALIAAAILPAERTITRSINIQKPAKDIFPVVADFTNWNYWDPWSEMDPEAKFEISDKSYGINSKMEWNGEEIGVGSLTTIEYIENEKLLFDLVFDENSAKVNKDEWNFEDTDTGTYVTWTTHLTLSYPLERLFGVFIENMLGPQKEKGLSNLKEYAESLETTPDTDINTVQVEAKPIYYISDSTDMKENDIPQKLGNAYGILGEFCGKNGIEITEQPIVITRKFEIDNIYEFDAAFIVKDNSIEPTGEIQKGMTYEGKAIKAVHIGDYESLVNTYNIIENYMKNNNLETNGDSWEQYISDPSDTPAKELITYVFYPVK